MFVAAVQRSAGLERTMLRRALAPRPSSLKFRKMLQILKEMLENVINSQQNVRKMLQMLKKMLQNFKKMLENVTNA